jgi:hypothetical protein
VIQALGLGAEEEEEGSDDSEAEEVGEAAAAAVAKLGATVEKKKVATPGKKQTGKQAMYAKGVHIKGAGAKKKKKNLNGGRGKIIMKHKGKPRNG